MTVLKKMVPLATVILVMIGLIPLIQNDYLLTGVYLALAIATILHTHEKDDYAAYIFGLIALTISEYVFIHMEVETFNRTTLLGVMPLWLPFLWAYGFLAIKRTLRTF